MSDTELMRRAIYLYRALKEMEEEQGVLLLMEALAKVAKDQEGLLAELPGEAVR